MDVQCVWLVNSFVVVRRVTLAKGLDCLLWDVVGSSQVADETDFNCTPKDQSVDWIANQYCILDRVFHCWVLNRRVYSNIKAIQLYHLFNAPYSQFTIKWSRYKVRWLALDWFQRRYSSRMALKHMNGLWSFILLGNNANLLFVSLLLLTLARIVVLFFFIFLIR